VRIGPPVCRFRTLHAQSRARSLGALHFTLGQRNMMGNQPLRHRDFRAKRAELGPYAAGHTSCPLPIRDTINGIPLGSRWADGSRLWRPRSATGVFSCVGYAWTTTRPHGHGGATWSMESEADQRGAPLLSLRCSPHRRLPAPWSGFSPFGSARFPFVCGRLQPCWMEDGRQKSIGRKPSCSAGW
jgi:hypothetical protein